MKGNGSGTSEARAPGVEIRELGIDDLPAIYRLGEQLFRAESTPTLYRTWDEYDVVDLYSSDGETCLVAESEGQIVGFALGSVIEKRHGPWCYGYVEWIGVDPGFARRGIGQRLFRALTDRFIDGGARMILVDTEADNDQAIAFFHRLGFGHAQSHVYLTLNLTHHRGYARRRARKGQG
jgi:ribosomal protein S18 acetylase RimI-like enzyme